MSDSPCPDTHSRSRLGGTDVHAHVLDPDRPVAPGAAYGPEPGHRVAVYRAHLAALGLERGVLVSASGYGTDNTVLAEALATDPARLRGVGVVTAEVSDDALDALVATGVRGVRVQDLYPLGAPLEALEVLGPRLAARGMHVEVWTDLARHLDWLPAAIARCPAPVVLDHLGWCVPGGDAVPAMLDLARDGHVWITVSGAYRRRPDLAAVEASAAMRPLVHALTDAVPDRLLWGSDWPFVGMGGRHPSPAELVDELAVFFPDDALRRRVLVENAAAAYDL